MECRGPQLVTRYSDFSATAEEIAALPEHRIFEQATIEVMQVMGFRIAKIHLAASIRKRLIPGFITPNDGKQTHNGMWNYATAPEVLVDVVSQYDAVLFPDFGEYAKLSRFDPVRQSHKGSYTGNFHTDEGVEANMVLHQPVKDTGNKLRSIVTVMGNDVIKGTPATENNLSSCIAIGLAPHDALMFGGIMHVAAKAREVGIESAGDNQFGENTEAHLSDLYKPGNVPAVWSW